MSSVHRLPTCPSVEAMNGRHVMTNVDRLRATSRLLAAYDEANSELRRLVERERTSRHEDLGALLGQIDRLDARCRRWRRIARFVLMREAWLIVGAFVLGALVVRAVS